MTYTALVTGATGIIGNATLRRLVDSDSWSTIHAVSRSTPDITSGKVVHHAVDLLGSRDDVVKQLKDDNVKDVEYVFFAAYKAEDTEEKATETNGKMLRNLLEALQIVDGKLKKVCLISGYKFYGVHLGQVRVPMIEDDPRMSDAYPPNFYYKQEDILVELSEKHGWDWTIAMPNDVAGYSKGNFMNISSCIALYARVCKELNEPFYFPGNELFWDYIDDISYAEVIAEFQEFIALKQEASGKYNIFNGDIHVWSQSWPKIAKYFGLSVPEDNFTAATPYGSEQTLPHPPPINERLAETSIAKPLKPSVVKSRVSLVKWSQRKEVKEAWERLAKRDGLEMDAFEKGTWGFGDFVFGRQFQISASMTKARKLGWTGYQDTFEGFAKVFDRLKKEKII